MFSVVFWPFLSLPSVCFNSCSTYSVSVSQGFYQVCLLVWDISVSFSYGYRPTTPFLLSTFVLGGGGSVAIGQCCLYAGYCDWGLGISCVMSHSRWFEVA